MNRSIGEIERDLERARSLLDARAFNRDFWAGMVADFVSAGDHKTDPEELSALLVEYRNARDDVSEAEADVQRLRAERLAAPLPVPERRP